MCQPRDTGNERREAAAGRRKKKVGRPLSMLGLEVRFRVPCGSGRQGAGIGLAWGTAEAWAPASSLLGRAAAAIWRPRFTCCTHSAKKATERIGRQWKPPHCTLRCTSSTQEHKSADLALFLSCTSTACLLSPGLDDLCCCCACRCRVLSTRLLSKFFFSRFGGFAVVPCSPRPPIPDLRSLSIIPESAHTNTTHETGRVEPP